MTGAGGRLSAPAGLPSRFGAGLPGCRRQALSSGRAPSAPRRHPPCEPVGVFLALFRHAWVRLAKPNRGSLRHGKCAAGCAASAGAPARRVQTTVHTDRQEQAAAESPALGPSTPTCHQQLSFGLCKSLSRPASRPNPSVTAPSTRARPARRAQAIRASLRYAAAARPGLFPVLRAKAAQARRVAEAGAMRSLDLHRQKTAAGLDHEIHFFSCRGAPVEDFGAAEAGIAPSTRFSRCTPPGSTFPARYSANPVSPQ